MDALKALGIEFNHKINIAASFLSDCTADDEKRDYLRSLISTAGSSESIEQRTLEGKFPSSKKIIFVEINRTSALMLYDNLIYLDSLFESVLEVIDAQCFIQHPNKKPLAIIEMQALYARLAYKDLYRLVTNEDSNSRFLITGTSGVGKSCFLLYLLIRLLCNSDDSVIIFQPADGEL
ncbi:5654_t:CDS:2, partial [Racocetra fulgida]